MTPEELNALITQGETAAFELKSRVTRPDIIARILGSFANTDGGTIAFGIREPHSVLGVDPDRARKAIETASRMLSPTEDVDIEVVELEGKEVALAHIKRSSSLIAALGAYYRRRGDASHAITANEIRTHFAEAAPEKDAADDLAEAVAKQTKTIEKLTEDFAKANSVKRKIAIGAIGAVIGAVLKALIGALMVG